VAKAVVTHTELHRVRHKFPEARQERLLELLTARRMLRGRQNSRSASQTEPDNALLAQHSIGVANGMEVDPKGSSQLTNTGQFIARPELATAQLLLDGGGNLQVDGPRVVMVD
jgi:hypothetical protein